MCSDEFNVIQCRTLPQHPQYTVRCTHYTLLSTARCFQSVCNSVTPWCVILSPPIAALQSTHQYTSPPNRTRADTLPQGLSHEMRTVFLGVPSLPVHTSVSEKHTAFIFRSTVSTLIVKEFISSETSVTSCLAVYTVLYHTRQPS
jgi:hypothetical protein